MDNSFLDRVVARAGEDPPVVELDHAHAEWVRVLLALT